MKILLLPVNLGMTLKLPRGEMKNTEQLTYLLFFYGLTFKTELLVIKALGELSFLFFFKFNSVSAVHRILCNRGERDDVQDEKILDKKGKLWRKCIGLEGEDS